MTIDERDERATNAKVIRGMSAAKYHATDAINASGLKTILDRNLSVQHLIHQRANPKSSTTYTRGHAIHALILEGREALESRFIKSPHDAFRSKDAKAWKAAAEADGLTPLTAAVWAQVEGAAAAVAAHPLASSLLNGGERELCLFWEEARHGLECKAMIDSYREDINVIVDLKSAADASPEGFSKAVGNFAYYVQDEWYRRAITAAFGVEPRAFAFVVVEHEPPHGVGVYTVGAMYRELSPAATNAALDAWNKHLTDPNAWKGYPTEITTIDPPVWITRKLEIYQ